MTHKIEIDWGELEIAFETGARGMAGMQNYLDLETGKVELVTDEAASYLDDPDADPPDWMEDMIAVAREVEEESDRYLPIPDQDSHEGYRDMEHFIGTVESDHLRDRLWDAVQGRGAFRRFKDVLLDHPAEEDRWYAFKASRVQGRLLDWLESQGIEPLNPKALPDPT